MNKFSEINNCPKEERIRKKNYLKYFLSIFKLKRLQ